MIGKKLELDQVLGGDDSNSFNMKKEKLTEELMKISHEIELMEKNIEIKKRSKQTYHSNLEELSLEYENHKEINHQ